MASVVGFDEENVSDQSAFVWFVSILVVLVSIFINIIWKVLITCFRRFVNEKISGTLIDNEVGTAWKHTKDAATQTLERYGCNDLIGPVYVTRSGERWHKRNVDIFLTVRQKCLHHAVIFVHGWFMRMCEHR